MKGKRQNYSHKFSWSRIFRLKMFGIVGLILLHSLHWAYMTFFLESFSKVLCLSTICFLWNYTLALIVTTWHKKRNVISSGGMFIYWLLTLCCSGIMFQSTLRSGGNWDVNVSGFFYIPILTFPIDCFLLILNCWADLDPGTNKKNSRPCPDNTASFFSKLLFYWYEELASRGYKKPLEADDLWELNPRESCGHQVPKFLRFWSKPIKVSGKSAEPQRRGNAFISAIQAVLPTIRLGALFQLGSDIFCFVAPEILRLLIAFTSNKEIETWKGYLFVGILLISSSIQTVFLTQFMQITLFLWMRLKTMLISAIYQKSLRISNTARKTCSVGEIVNLMSVDILKILNLITFINEFWSAPLKIGACIYFLWQILGPSVLAGVGVMVCLIPCNAILGKWSRRVQLQEMKNKDQRVKLMGELLAGIKVLKLYAWEPPFAKKVMDVRQKEQDLLKKVAYLKAGMSLLSTLSPFLVSLATFGVYVSIDEEHSLDAAKAFVSLALFNIMKQPLQNLPETIVTAIEAGVALKRINGFLNAEELDDTAIQTSHSNEDDQTVIEIRDGTFSWNPKLGDGEIFQLNNINLRVKKKSLVAIIGVVGAGKSSLLSALLGEMVKVSGKVKRIGKVAYVSQQPWIQNCSLRDNILFGKEFNEEKYDRVIAACALLPDIAMLPAGDQTEIGEKGVNLSGGQKQRVSLARAAYSNADICLLDDPLSAVDAHVGQHLFHEVLGPEGLLKSKTRLLVTHGIKYLRNVNNIAVMKDGRIDEIGTYNELLAGGREFSLILNNYANETQKQEKVGDELPSIKLRKSKQRLHSTGSEGKPSQLLRRNSMISATSAMSLLELELEEIEPQIDDETMPKMETLENKVLPEKERLIQAEKTEVGSVKLNVYLGFMTAMGWPMSLTAILLSAAYHGLQLGSSVWLAKWTSDNSTMGNPTYLGVYGLFGLGQAITTMIGTAAMSLALLQAASVLHQSMLSSILKSRMSFFETTPLGRILNRFSKDIDTVDTSLQNHMRLLIQHCLSLVVIITIICINTPLFLVIVGFLSLAYFNITKFYLGAKRQLKRLVSVSLSPIFSQFSETLAGTATIRAYGAEERFITELEGRVDFHQKCYYPSIVANRWLAVRLEGIGNLVVFSAGLLSVAGRDHLDPGAVGLSLSYAMQITTTLNWLVRMASEVETDAVSVERILEYGQDTREQEAEWVCESKLSPTWPEQGGILIKNLETRYRPGLDLVLKGISLEIKPHEKIGVVGRTGSGKSSLTLSLFRILEPVGGSISIDGVDIANLGLHDIRGRLTIIPQDAVVFSGSLRMNLDPFQEYEDSEVWKVLELVQLGGWASQVPEGLNYEMGEGGDNLSVGQKQLICLGRAMLRRRKNGGGSILVLDEATASIDLETDEIVQAKIRDEFKNATVISIAHRLKSVLDSDRIMVLDCGQVVEMDSPGVLLQNKNSVFYSLAKTEGLV